MTRAFLIGAGATNALFKESPLSEDFLGILKEEKPILFDGINSEFHNLIPKKLEKMNIEDLMILSENFGGPHRDSLIMSVYNGIYALLGELTDKLGSDINLYLTKGNPASFPTHFKTLLKHSDKRDFFMTLNYDLILDWEVISTTYSHTIDYTIKPGFLAEEEYPYMSKYRHYSVYHLHGCLGWENVNDKKIKIHMEAISPTHTLGGCNACLVPPGNKDFPPVVRNIWNVAETRLSQVKELIIIGCSLNLKDEKLIDLVKQFIKMRGEDQVKVIYFRDPSDKRERPTPVEKNYISLLGKIFNGFNQSFNLEAIRFIFEK